MHEETKEEYGVLIAKKSEKLVTALYLVTDLIFDSEPIKANLRKLAITLLSSMNTLAQPEVKDRITEYKMSLRSVTEILSLLHVARATGIVSEMNGTLLIDGLRSLQLILENKQPVLTKEMLTIQDEEKLQMGGPSFPTLNSSSYDAITPRSLLRTNIQTNERVVSPEKKDDQTLTIKDKVKGHVTYNQKTPSDEENNKMAIVEKQRASLSSFQQRKVSRRDQILNLFVKGVDVSIKDIAMRIKGCSEKTIQRELNALVYDNVVMRIGEKRWSRYMLK